MTFKYTYGMLLRSVTCAAAIIGATSASAATVELVVNGDFSAGSTGFTSDFADAGGSGPGLAQFSIRNSNYFGLLPQDGNFMAVNGGNLGALPTVWSQDIAVTAGTEYTFSFQLGGTTTVPTPAGKLSIQFDGAEFLNATASTGSPAAFQLFESSFVASATGIFALSFVEQSTGFGGNDYGIDDISLTFDDSVVSPPAVPLPAAGWMLLAGVGGLAAIRRRKTS